MKIYRKIDPFTNKEFETVSSIKRFESKENQVAYNNQKARKEKQERAFVDDKIKHNHFVLSRLLGDKDEVIITEEHLKNVGFHFRVLTHFANKKGTIIMCVYNYCFIQLESNNEFKITKDGKDYIA